MFFATISFFEWHSLTRFGNSDSFFFLCKTNKQTWHLCLEHNITKTQYGWGSSRLTNRTPKWRAAGFKSDPLHNARFLHNKVNSKHQLKNSSINHFTSEHWFACALSENRAFVPSAGIQKHFAGAEIHELTLSKCVS
jgi:hypothetical protein